MTNVCLVGFGVENRSVRRYFENKNVSVTICDQNPDTELPKGVEAQLGDQYLDNLNRFDVIVRSVGINPSIILEKNPGTEAKITTAVNLFFEECSATIVGITGTKGKGTTSTLVHKIFEAAGKKTLLAGNIGLPMLDTLVEAQSCDYVVLELSSFQLYDLRRSPQVAACLMVVPEHLNWHEDMDDYKNAKANIFRYQRPSDRAIFNNDNANSIDIASISKGLKLSYSTAGNSAESYLKDGSIYYKETKIADISEIKLLGTHNLENICAAIATTYDLIGGNVEAIRSIITTFSGLPYRLELRRELDEVRYYNDSFSTTPETAIAAINAIVQPKIIVLGGSDKGADFNDLADCVSRSNVKHVLAIGDRGPIIADLLRSRGYNNITEEGLVGMKEIVDKAKSLAEPGDAVLLSTGCASFDMFKDYKDRGNQFNEVVESLS